jgi:carbonic anhydrase
MPRTTPAQALELLKAGNARFASGAPQAEAYGPRIAELASGQSPFATVLGCSDSRVPIETVFDQAPGALFVIRVAGNFLNNDNLGSIEFAVEILNVNLIVVLGHESCGAVTAALEYVREGIGQQSHIQNLVDAVAPAVRAARELPGEWLENAIALNVERNVKAMPAQSNIIAKPFEAGALAVVGAIYSVRTGKVDFIG